ncbi:MAG: 30S ribosomal protein S6 [bacterium]|nr:30S ribosomal protein S6 [bacterium]
MVKNYELLFILPGTLAETEVTPVVDTVKVAIEKGGGKSIKVKDLGKSRIAYPIRHIRYGYFQLCNFDAETTEIKTIRENLGLLDGLLRVVIKITGINETIPDKISAISDVTVRDNEPVRTVRHEVSRPKENVEASHKINTKKKDKAEASQRLVSLGLKKTETKAENIKMEDIDKKLDELLGGDIADV